MRAYRVLVVAAVLLLGADEPTKDEGMMAATGLEGTWALVSSTREGKEDGDPVGTIMAFRGGVHTVKVYSLESSFSYHINPHTGTIDLDRFLARVGRDYPKGIYQLRGNELKICWSSCGRRRPKDFTAAKGSGDFLVVLRRLK